LGTGEQGGYRPADALLAAAKMLDAGRYNRVHCQTWGCYGGGSSKIVTSLSPCRLLERPVVLQPQVKMDRRGCESGESLEVHNVERERCGVWV